MKLSIRALASLALYLLLLSAAAKGAIITVTQTGDDNDGICNSRCTLREAIQAAGPSDEVVFSSTFDSPQIINLTGGHITTNGITITGPGSHLLTVRSVIGQSPISRIFNFNGSINLSGMTITGGNVNGAGGGGIAIGSGTAILNDVVVTANTSAGGVTAFSGGITMSGGLLIMNNCAVTNNTTSSPFEDTGGGIRVFGGELQMTNSTVSGNRSTLGNFNGGGIYLRGPGTFTNTTITDNETVGSQRASGLYNAGFDDIVLNNSIVAGNRNNTTHPDVTGQFASTSSFNLIGNVGAATGLTAVNNNQLGSAGSPIDPRLYPLGSYGGNTPTHALRSNSTAIDPAGLTGAPLTDQRGATRPFVGADIGAFEFLPMVTNINDGGAGSLRQAIADVPAGGIVMFEPDFFAATARVINIGANLSIDKDLTVAGTGANFLNVHNVAAQGINNRVFSIGTAGTIVKLSGMTVSGGNDMFFAGGISNFADLTVTACYITGNRSTAFAGGIVSIGRLKVVNSTISGNIANSGANTKAGGISNRSGTAVIINSTISGNGATGGVDNGGGIWTGGAASVLTVVSSTIADNGTNGTGSASGIFQDAAAGTSTIGNTIIAANQGNDTFPDVAGAFISNGFNLVGNIGTSSGFGASGDQLGNSPLAPRSSKSSSLAPAAVLDPRLTPLDLNGAAIPTHGLQGTSPAMDKGNCFGCSLDQRGMTRPIDLPAANFPGSFGGADIGAFEAQFVPTAASVSLGGRVVTANNVAIGNAEVILTGQSGQPRMARTNPFGYYRFEDIDSGETYFVGAEHKRYRFDLRIVTVFGELTDVDFIGQSF